MVGEEAREVGARIAAGATVMVTGKLRAVRGRSSVASGIEVLASGIGEAPRGAGS